MFAFVGNKSISVLQLAQTVTDPHSGAYSIKCALQSRALSAVASLIVNCLCGHCGIIMHINTVCAQGD